MAKNDKEPNNDILLLEYEKAQDSAEHHDSLAWQVSSVILAGMLVLIGFSLDHLGKQDLRFLVSLVALQGMILTVCLGWFQSTLRGIKRQKYDRCKEIEERLGMKQHAQLNYPEGTQTNFFLLVLAMFVLLWLIILVKSLCPVVCGP